MTDPTPTRRQQTVWTAAYHNDKDCSLGAEVFTTAAAAEAFAAGYLRGDSPIEPLRYAEVQAHPLPAGPLPPGLHASDTVLFTLDRSVGEAARYRVAVVQTNPHAAAGVDPLNDAYQLWWTAPGTPWHVEQYACLSTAITRLGALQYCEEQDWMAGFTHTANQFGRASHAFHVNLTTWEEGETIPWPVSDVQGPEVSDV